MCSTNAFPYAKYFFPCLNMVASYQEDAREEEMSMKKRFKFFRSLRFRIMVILVIIGIVPSVAVEKGILNSYEDRAVSLRKMCIRDRM